MVKKRLEPRPMRELHRIREEIYEETKHLSGEEWLAYFHEQAADYIRRNHLRVRIPQRKAA